MKASLDRGGLKWVSRDLGGGLDKADEQLARPRAVACWSIYSFWLRHDCKGVWAVLFDWKEESPTLDMSQFLLRPQNELISI